MMPLGQTLAALPGFGYLDSRWEGEMMEQSIDQHGDAPKK
jgi:hypothetical protein